MSSGNAARLGPLVSVIMPVYNAGPYLRLAIESVLSQTYSNWELIVIDDGSTDGCMATLDDIRDARIRRLRQANTGKPTALNRALEVARGDFYALLDADDISYPQRLERQVACLVAHPDVAGVFCGHDVIIDGRRLAPTFRAKSAAECKRDIAIADMPGHDPTAMYRLDVVKELRYAGDLPIVEGFDYILRVGERWPLMVVGECLYGYRIHPQSVTKRDPSRRNRLVQEVYNRMYDRRSQPRRPRIDVARPNSRRDADNDLVSHFTASVADQVLAGFRGNAIRTGWECWRMNALSPYYAKPFVYAWTPRRVMRAYRDRKLRHRDS